MLQNMLNVVRTGPGGDSPVVLVHPIGLDLSYWGEQIEALRYTHDVIAYDLPGHGRSPGNPQMWTLDQAAQALAGVIQSSGAQSAHVVGLSVGGMIAQATALNHPALLTSLTLISTAAVFSEEARSAMHQRAEMARDGEMAAVVSTTISRWFTHEFVVQRPDIIDRVEKTLLSDDPAIYRAIWEMIATLDLVNRLHQITVPTLILVGELDTTTPPAAAAVLNAHIANTEMHVIPNASHMVSLEKPSEVNRHLQRFLKINRASASTTKR